MTKKSKSIQNKSKNKVKNKRDKTKNKKHTNRKYSTEISVRIKSSTKNYLHERAQKTNTPTSKFIKILIYRYRHNSHNEIKLDDSQMNEIKISIGTLTSYLNGIYNNIYRIGGNLNQIAHEFHNNNFDPEFLKELKSNLNNYKTYEKLIQKIANALNDNIGMFALSNAAFGREYKGFLKYHKKLIKSKEAKRDESK